jgi:hypothetical protein
MYSATDKILQAADVLEKFAAYIEAEEVEEDELYESAIHKEYVKPITQAAENVPHGLEAKLAATDPDVLDFFKEVVGNRQENAGYTPMGGAAEKVASDASDPLLSFCLSED